MYIINDSRGITLVEALISILLLTITTIAVMGVLMSARLSIERAKNRTKAMNLLRARMEEVKSWSYADVKTLASSFGNNVDDAIGGDDLVNDTLTTPVTEDVSTGNLTITVTLNWEKQGMSGTLSKGTAANPDLELVSVMMSP